VRDDPATEGKRQRQRRGEAGASAVRRAWRAAVVAVSSLLQTAGEESGERESRGKGMIDGRKRNKGVLCSPFLPVFLKENKS
jgi:hypothetical protein